VLLKRTSPSQVEGMFYIFVYLHLLYLFVLTAEPRMIPCTGFLPFVAGFRTSA